MLGRPCAVRIVWVCNSADMDAAQPNYRLLHWRNPHINGVGFAESNAYDIRGLSAIISRTVPHNAIPYILGATGEGRKELCLHPGFRLPYINYVFIENDKDVRTWLLLNSVLEDPFVTTLQIGSYSGLDSSPYGIPSGNHIEDRPVYLVYYR